MIGDAGSNEISSLNSWEESPAVEVQGWSMEEVPEESRDQEWRRVTRCEHWEMLKVNTRVISPQDHMDRRKRVEGESVLLSLNQSDVDLIFYF